MASIVLVGRLTVLSPSHQLLFQLGGSSSTLATLCQLPIQYYMMECFSFLDSIVKIDNKTAEISTESLQEAARSFALQPTTADYFDSLTEKDIAHFQERLFAIAVEGRADDDENSLNDRRATLALRLLYNAGNRSDRLRKTLPADVISLFRALLRFAELRSEVIALMVQLFDKIHLDCALKADYQLLLGEICVLWEKDGKERQWIDAFLLNCLEKDGAFLAHSFADFQSDHFSALLTVTEAFIEAELEIHMNNVQFAVDLIIRIVYDFGEELVEERQRTYIEWLLTLMKIIGFAALQKRYEREVDSRRLVHSIRQVLETVVDAESLDQIDAPVIIRAPDRPLPPPITRRDAVLNSPGLTRLSSAIHRTSIEKRALLKCETIASIGNLCSVSEANRLEAGQNGGVLLVLSCAKLGPNDRPFIVQWCITTLRFMVLGCPENQRELAMLDDKPSGVIDRSKLLEQLGLKCEIEADGRVRIMNEKR